MQEISKAEIVSGDEIENKLYYAERQNSDKSSCVLSQYAVLCVGDALAVYKGHNGCCSKHDFLNYKIMLIHKSGESTVQTMLRIKLYHCINKSVNSKLLRYD
jgi:hypothetical protein